MTKKPTMTYLEAIEQVLKGKDGRTISNQVLIERVIKLRPGSSVPSIRSQIGEVREKLGIPIPKRGLAAIKPPAAETTMLAAALLAIKLKGVPNAKAAIKKLQEDDVAMFAISCGGIDKALELLDAAQERSSEIQALL